MAMGSLLIVLNFIYNCTIGPSTYTIIGEISSTRLRQKTIVLARASYKAINIVAGILNPRMLCELLLFVTKLGLTSSSPRLEPWSEVGSGVGKYSTMFSHLLSIQATRG
jgi:hypothetical protein